MSRLRLGAVAYLNARPLVFGLERSPRFDLRFDVPSECARLLHARSIDVGLIPSIEYLRGPQPYSIVPGLAIASRGAVKSVAIYTTRPMADVRSIALDTNSRTSVALVRVLCDRLFRIQPVLEPRGPDLTDMLAACDAALIIGDNALLIDHATVRLKPDTTEVPVRLKPDTTESHPSPVVSGFSRTIEKIDLGVAWTDMTGLPFVYAFWAGWPDVMTPEDVTLLQQARDAGVARSEEIAREYFQGDAGRQAIGARYLRDNIKCYLADNEVEGLRAFYRYSAELGLVSYDGALNFYHAEHYGAG